MGKSENHLDDQQPRTSKLAVLTLVMGVLSPLTLFLLTLPTLIVGVVARIHIRKSGGRLIGNSLAGLGMSFPFVWFSVIFVLWQMDAGPVPNEFTEDDLIQVQPENEATYAILCRLDDDHDDPNGAPAIGLTRDDVMLLDELFEQIYRPDEKDFSFELVREHADEIRHLWDCSAKGRAILAELEPYGEIADLTPSKLAAETPYLYDLRRLCQINVLQTLRLLANREGHQAARQLIEFDTLVRKHSIFARSLIVKLVCYALIDMDLYTANIILHQPQTSNDTLVLLGTHFKPLKTEQMTLKNAFINEYLIFKNAAHDLGNSSKLLLKPNSVCRYYDGLMRNRILTDQGKAAYDYCQISVWPWEKPIFPKVPLDAETVVENRLTLYYFYNPGKMLLMILMPATDKIVEIKTKILIRDDLLQWVLARRLGEAGSLKARADSDEYTIDIEKGLIFSVGPDGVAYTEDDIKLPINPAVLGLN